MVKKPLANGFRFNPWVGKIRWRRVWQPTPVFLLGESHGQRSLAGYSPRDLKSRTRLSALTRTCSICSNPLILQAGKVRLREEAGPAGDPGTAEIQPGTARSQSPGSWPLWGAGRSSREEGRNHSGQVCILAPPFTNCVSVARTLRPGEASMFLCR